MKMEAKNRDVEESAAGYETKLYCIIVQVIQCSLLLRSVELSMQIAADQRSARVSSRKDTSRTLNNPPTDHEPFQNQEYTASHLRILLHPKILETARKV